MALLEAEKTSLSSSNFSTSVFSKGNFPIQNVDSTSSSSPKPLFIVTPTTKGTYPVVLFFHGFCIPNHFYTELLQHISSHGFILVAPQLYEMSFFIPSGHEELETAAKVTNWLEQGLQSLLPENVSPDFTKVALAGHSRGGKTAFTLALGLAKTEISLKFSVLLGIDPVAGSSKSQQLEPHILTYVPCSFNLSIPVAVIGTGLGPDRANPLFPPCAPDGVNHEEFYSESKPPRAHFSAKDYGHMDMLDDDRPGFFGKLSECMCKNGAGSKNKMRRSVGGIVVAFLRAYVEGNDEDLKAIVGDPSLAPAKLDEVHFVPA